MSESEERRSGFDRRRSNWRDATQAIPPPAQEAVALRHCVETIRNLVAQTDDLTASALWLRTVLDNIELTILTLDDAVRQMR